MRVLDFCQPSLLSSVRNAMRPASPSVSGPLVSNSSHPSGTATGAADTFTRQANPGSRVNAIAPGFVLVPPPGVDLANDPQPEVHDAFRLEGSNANERLSRAWGPVGHLNAVMNSPELREAYNATLPVITQYYAELGQNHALYERFKALRNSPEYTGLSAARKKIIENELPRPRTVETYELPLFTEYAGHIRKLIMAPHSSAA